jgi:hypothetical protein
VDAIVSLLSVRLLILFYESDESRPLHFHRLTGFVVQGDHKVEEIALSQIGRRLLLEMGTGQSDAGGGVR